MQVTARVDIALRVMLAIAEQSAPTPTVALAERLDVSYAYLLSIVGELRRAGLLRARRGAGGGLLLSRPSADISLADVIVAIDGPLVLPHEGMTDEPRPGDACPAGGAEYLHNLWLSAYQAMLDVFGRVQLDEARLALAGDTPAR